MESIDTRVEWAGCNVGVCEGLEKAEAACGVAHILDDTWVHIGDTSILSLRLSAARRRWKAGVAGPSD